MATAAGVHGTTPLDCVVDNRTWQVPSVLSALGILFSIVFVVLRLPLVLRDMPMNPADVPE